ncbi:restriction endonuclease subunit S [Proteus sp. PR00174]|uniref:restriction endonuclease subunit S n=1 Tax=Proteus sp. PR00174 TaxID=2794024 RepID=UPI001E51EE6C|nr:restriction endonuclease subunit S [Proteus sp. PR00174]
MTKYKAYPEYKDSGVEWLGNMPTSWERISLRFLVSSIRNGSTATQIEHSEESVAISRIETISSGEINMSKVGFVDSKTISNTYKLMRGDLLLSHINSLPMVGNVALKRNDDVLYHGMNLLRIISEKKIINSSYLYWIIKSSYCRQIIESVAKPAINQASVSIESLKAIQLIIPKLKEQAKIVSFLDHETTKIDSLIEKQQQLIELLKEKRQAVISHAVTKGLNPDVPMKDSRVEWLGEVPEHWSIKSYRYACLIYRGKFGHRPRNDPSLYDGDYPFIQTGDVARSSKFIETYSQTLNEKGKAVSQLFPSGTLMMAIAANIGDTAILGFEAYAPDSVVGFKPYQNIHLEFLRYSFMAALPALEQTSTQSTQANLNIDRIGAVKAVFPPLEEQLDIIDYLDNMLCSYDSIEENANQAILFLQERRTALISAAVTGKIDVRDWVAPDTQETEKIEEAAV